MHGRTPGGLSNRLSLHAGSYLSEATGGTDNDLKMKFGKFVLLAILIDQTKYSMQVRCRNSKSGITAMYETLT